MRVVTWNCCRGPLASKLAALDTLQADIAVLQECPRPPAQSSQLLWFGDNPRQGLAVIARRAFRLRRLRAIAGAPRHIAPVAVTGPMPFPLFAVWAMNDRPHHYVRGVVRMVALCRARLRRTPGLLLGDLNSNAMWDRKDPASLNHSALVRDLAALGMHSCYHVVTGEAHGAESRPTFHLHRNRQRPYHIDYCFAPRAWIAAATTVTVGTHEDWSMHSDHMPLIVDFAAHDRSAPGEVR